MFLGAAILGKNHYCKEPELSNLNRALKVAATSATGEKSLVDGYPEIIPAAEEFEASCVSAKVMAATLHKSLHPESQ